MRSSTEHCCGWCPPFRACWSSTSSQSSSDRRLDFGSGDGGTPALPECKSPLHRHADECRSSTAMTMTPRLRTLALTAHVTSSVSWLGSVAAFFALAVAGLTSHDTQMVRGAYVATELITWFVIVPLAFGSLLTGLVVSLGSSWGLFRHYWVLVKFMLTILATALLLLHTQPIGILAAVARETASFSDFRRLQIQLVGDAGAALLVLLVNVTLSVYKPQGMTAYGRRKQ